MRSTPHIDNKFTLRCINTAKQAAGNLHAIEMTLDNGGYRVAQIPARRYDALLRLRRSLETWIDNVILDQHE